MCTTELSMGLCQNHMWGCNLQNLIYYKNFCFEYNPLYCSEQAITYNVCSSIIGREELLVINDTELLHLDFLTHAYEFLNDCAISYLFTAEEQAHINNSVRSDMNQAGIHFTSATAWNFFLKLVMKFTILYSENTICSAA